MATSSSLLPATSANPTALLRQRHAREKHDLERFEAQLGFVRGLCELHPAQADAWRALSAQAAQAFASEGLAAGEAVLAPLAATAKSYTIHCVGHAHIDMNWLWGWAETVAITLDTFRTVLALMDEFPAFHFSQSQASVYRIVEEHDPALLERIRARIKEGRWEVTASHWVEGERNIAGGEALVRQLSETRRYLQGLLGLSPEDVPIDWSPDTFGHAATIPAIDGRAGVRYLYCCRTGRLDRPMVFWWRAPDGTRILVNREIAWYNGEAAPSMTGKLVEFSKSTGLRTWMQVYGVGDHGGGPTRRDLRRFADMDAWPVFPRFRFGRAVDFFQLLEAEGARWPTLDHELNFEFSGCYTSQSQIKRGNRQGERRMAQAETALALTGGRQTALSESWRKVLFGHFHDILPGSGLPATREWQGGLMQAVEADAGGKTRAALRSLAARIHTGFVAASGEPDQPSGWTSRAFGAGVGAGFTGRTGPHQAGDGPRAFVVFNPTASPRDEVVRLTVWDGEDGHEAPPLEQRPWRAVLPDGTRIAVQKVGHGDYWGHRYVDLLAPVHLGSLGWQALAIEEGDAPGPVAEAVRGETFMDGGHGQRQNLPTSPITLDNGVVAIVVDRASGAITSLRRDGVEFAAAGFAVPEHQQERPTGMSAWILGDLAGPPRPLAIEEVKLKESGPYRAAVEMRSRLNQSTVTVTYALTHGSPLVEVEVKARWVEIGNAQTGIPRLQIALPTALVGASGLYEIPFGAVVRGDLDGRAVPALRWAAVVGSCDGRPAGVQLLNNGAHGHTLERGTLRLHLVRSSYDPDPLPEVADHVWRLGIVPWTGARSEADLVRTAAAFDQPAEAISTSVHAGDLPSSATGIAVAHPDLVVTSVKPADDGDGVIVRLANHGAAAAEAVISVAPGLPFTAAVVGRCDLLERAGSGSGAVPAHGLATLRLAAAG